MDSAEDWFKVVVILWFIVESLVLGFSKIRIVLNCENLTIRMQVQMQHDHIIGPRS